jgi:thiol-disulfide isomerase/thioredoxin
VSEPAPPPAPHLSTGRKLGIGALAVVAIGIVVALLAGVGGDGGGGDSASDADADNGPMVALPSGAGEPVGSVELAELGYETFDGGAADLGTFAGQPLVLNFFASWCTPCVAEMPDLEAAADRYGDQVGFLGLAVRDRVEDARRIVEETGVTYPVGLDRDALIERFQGLAMPSTVFIAADGEVLDTHLGVLSPEQLDEKLATYGFA